MSRFALGDRVHIVSLGTGIVRDARNGDRYLVEIKGRTMVVEGSQMEAAAPERALPRGKREGSGPAPASPSGPSASLDLHGRTVLEAIEALDAFLNDALLAGSPEARVIHGRSGGAVKAAVHKRLAQLPPVRSFRLDPRNAGVTIVTL